MLQITEPPPSPSPRSRRRTLQILLSQRRTLEEDLLSSPPLNPPLPLEARYTQLLNAASLHSTHLSTLHSPLPRSTSSKKLPSLHQTSASLINAHLSTHEIHPQTANAAKWCNILGIWLPSPMVRCAHFVPFSWDVLSTTYMFGSDELPWMSKRSGVSAHGTLAGGLEDGWIVIVPVSGAGIEGAPGGEWEVVLLSEGVRGWEFYRDYWWRGKGEGERERWCWGDWDGRRLSWRNGNKPARRLLFLRFVLAWLEAERKGWKLPSAAVWTTPDKTVVYLRSPVLLEVGRVTGGELPAGLIEAGAFEDESTESRVREQVAGMAIGEHVLKYLDGRSDANEGEGDEDEDDDED